MPAGNAVWGIDIGQCALKALRCQVAEDGTTVVADAFDFIEYPKILSQPEANREELVHEALELFLSRNTVRGDKVAISVSGQSGLARFFKPPPVEARRLPDIVKYEARQQIPFSLEEVIWDFQQMPGGAEEEGVALDTEVGLFAMKREHVFRALEPFEDVGMELDVVQLSPLCIYNYAAYDLMTDIPPTEEYDPEAPPDSVVILSLGTDATDLVVTNGFRVWQRSIPLGGNHFTRQLTSELKLTFAKAEHLKRNARQAEDPKTVFKAMRPVFNDLVTEVQRSISYFQSIDRKAKLSKVVCVGNATKLPGLQQYLAANLGLEVDNIEKYGKLHGAKVVATPAFKDNLLAYPVCYGLCLQALGKANVYTSLLPKEILTNRLIREKKPWAVAVAALFLLAFVGHYAFQMRQVRSADITNSGWAKAMRDVDGVETESTIFITEYEKRLQERDRLDTVGERVVGTNEQRLLWPELLKVIDQCLPRGATATGDISEEGLSDRPELYIQTIECRRFDDLAKWYPRVKDEIRKSKPTDMEDLDGGPPTEGEDAPDDDADGNQPAADGTPEGEGWVVEIRGYHFHNEDNDNRGRDYLINTIIKGLYGTVQIPDGPGGDIREFTTRELGISAPAIISKKQVERIPNPLLQKKDAAAAAAAFGGGRGGGHRGGFGAAPFGGGGATPDPKAGPDPEAVDPSIPKSVNVYRFTIQFCWQQTTKSQRRANEEGEAERTDVAGT